MTCGHLCAPDAENCPSCGGEPFPSGNRHAAQNEASEDSWASETVVTQAKGTGSRTDTESRIVHQINIGQQAPQAPQAASATKTSGLAVAALVLGIVGIVVLPFLAPQILALIFGAVARRDIPRNPALTGKGMATAGLVLGIIGVSLWFVWIIAWLEGGRTF
ncbi:MAG: DUF4190 domain-containing protein [Phycisphaerae bacterium]|nr:DUF4190 domain-containing protein [Phycisphaerae bacterium]